MLVLSRKKNEGIEIEGGIIVRIVDIRGDKVRIGIDAPEQVQVHREEVAIAMRRDGRPFRSKAKRKLDTDQQA